MENMMKDWQENLNKMQSFWEARMSETMDEFVKSQNFIQALTKSMEGSLEMKKVMDDTLSRWADFYQVVTKKDLAILQQQMFDQNAKLERTISVLEEIRDSIETIGSDSASEKPSRTTRKSSPKTSKQS